MNFIERKTRLEALLLGFQGVWRPQPFKVETPDWCADYPELTQTLLGLDDESVERIGADNLALIRLVAGHIPELAELAYLIAFLPSPAVLPSPSGGGAGGEGATQNTTNTLTTEHTELPHPNPPPEGEGARRLYTDIPGRKEAQIVAYAAALGPPRAPLLEWCAGKGHLGRLLAHRWHWPVASLEIDSALCDAGEDLARHAKVDCMQHFVCADALAPESARHLTGRHVVTLHACGDLHTRLISVSAEHGSPALDVVPCCYYRTAADTYRAFNPTELVLNHDDLRLVVTETVTASARQRERSRRALAWKLGWVEWRKAATGETEYRSFPPVPEAWLKGDFAGFIGRMSARCLPSPPALYALQGTPPRGEGCAVAREREADQQLAHFETLGHTRAARMQRLQLARLAFRRALEAWLVMDMAVFLENHGYSVSVREFCPASLTPRNLLLSARRYNLPIQP